MPPEIASSEMEKLYSCLLNRVRETTPRCPVPVARGAEHLGVKQACFNAADEVFVVSPLGKLFVGQSNDAVNHALDLRQNAVEPESLAYDEIRMSKEQGHHVKLISTTRETAAHTEPRTLVT